MRYTDIGHSGVVGPVAVWSIDRSGRVHQDGELWTGIEHDRCIVRCPLNEPRTVAAFGRVELDRQIGSVCLTDGEPGDGLGWVLDALDTVYPGTRWYVFAVTHWPAAA